MRGGDIACGFGSCMSGRFSFDTGHGRATRGLPFGAASLRAPDLDGSALGRLTTGGFFRFREIDMGCRGHRGLGRFRREGCCPGSFGRDY